MPRPDSVKILGLTFPIFTEENGHFTEHSNGYINGDQQTITIASGIGRDKERETLLHEVLHGISFSMCSDLTEHQIRSMANGLYAVLTSNPKLVSYLMETQTDIKENNAEE